MDILYKSLSAAATSIILLGAAPVFGQTMSPSEMPLDVDKYTFKNIDQISAKEWIFSIEVSDMPMRESRFTALDRVSEEVSGRLNIEPGTLEGAFMDSMLIIDEDYAGATYTAKIRALSKEDDPTYALKQNRDTNFDTSEVNSDVRPAWVLLVPISIDEDDSWGVANAKSSWAQKWKIPFRDGITQFIPATIDSDDRSAAAQSSSFEELSEHFMSKYKATNVLYIAKSQSDLVSVFHWGESSATKPPEEVDAPTDRSDITGLRSAVLEGFWNAFDTQPAVSDDTGVDLIHYRFVGQPVVDDTNSLSGYMQFVLYNDTTWEQVYDRLSAIRKLTIIGGEEHNSSVLVSFQYDSYELQELQNELHLVGMTDRI